MKKLIVTFSFSLCFLNAFALEIADNFTYNTSFWRNSAAVSVRPSYPVSIGFGFDITEHDNFSNHIYALRLPMALRIDEMIFAVSPFYYPDNANGASAMGARAMFASLISRDEIENSTTRFHLSAGFASQKADIVKNSVLAERETFYQAAYELEVNFGYFEQYFFDIVGNIYQYPSGIDGVGAFGGVMNQTELADLGTLDYVLGLPYYSAGVRIRWSSDANSSDNFISYRYIDFHNTGKIHSLLLSSTVRMSNNFYLNLAYNHLFRSGRADTDLYSAGLIYKF